MDDKKTDEWWASYNKYLTTDEWAWVRRECIKRDRKCVKCGAAYKRGARFQAHHCGYRYVGHGDINELESVELHCAACHWNHHHPGGESYMQMIERRLREMLE